MIKLDHVFNKLFSIVLLRPKYKNDIYYRVVEMERESPYIRVQVINTRNTFIIKASKLIETGEIIYFSALDIILITYISTIEELNEDNINKIEVIGVKQVDNKCEYVIKNLITQTTSYLPASEFRKTKELMSLSKSEISNISYVAGYEDGMKTIENNQKILNNIKIKIKKIMISENKVEILVSIVESDEDILMDITELLFKKNMLSKDDNYCLGNINCFRQMG